MNLEIRKKGKEMQKFRGAFSCKESCILLIIFVQLHNPHAKICMRNRHTASSVATTLEEMKLQFKILKNGWVVNSVFHNCF